MDAPAQYLDELKEELGVYPTWFPGDPMELGAFGTIVRGRFVADGRLADLGIEIKLRQHEEKQSFKKQRGMKLQVASSGSAVGGAIDAALGIDFSIARDYAWAFVARGMSTTEIENILEVQRAVLEAYRAGDWRRKWLVVSEVRHVDHLNVVVARSKQARFRVRGKGTIAEPLDVLLQEEASFELSTDDVFTVPNARHVTPLYGLRKLQGFFDPALRPFSKGDYEELSLRPADDEPFFPDQDDAP